jgi:SSS family solute:Na+ symporter
MVIWIGFYLKGRSNTSEEFFMAGREMTAWIAGLELRLGQPGLAGADGLGRLGLPVRHSGHPLVLDRRHSRHALPGPGDDALLLRLQDALGARLPDLRYGGQASSVAAFSFATEMILMSGVNMFAMAVVMKVVLGWDITFSIFVSSVAVATLCRPGRLRSAIFNEVLQFVLIWGGALLVPILGLGTRRAA